MAKVTNNIVNKALRDEVFSQLIYEEIAKRDLDFHRINDRQYGVLITDLNGVQRYCRIGVIVAEEREDMTAEELMQSEINAYQAKQDAKAEKAKTKAEKIAKDKERRAKEKEEKENA